MGRDAIRSRFDGRTQQRRESALTQSGVWRFKELVMPGIRPEHVTSLGEGLMPFWLAGSALASWVGGDLDLWIVPEGLSPTGSFKDFGMTSMVSVAKQSGVKVIGCASTGDTSASGAAFAARAGMRCVVVLPQDGKVTSVQLSQPLAHGATVVTLPGNFDDAMRVIRQLAAMGLLLLANSINPARIEGHQASAFLTAQFFGWELPDYFALPLGNGSNTSSVGKGMQLLRDLGLVDRTSEIIATEAAASNPLARAWEEVNHGPERISVDEWKRAYRPQEGLGRTVATAMRIGNPVSYEKVMREIGRHGGAVLTAKEHMLQEAVMVAGRDGFSVCPQTGAALAGLRQAVSRGFVRRGARVVVISTATGLKFPNVPAAAGRKDIRVMDTCDPEKIASVLGL